MERMFDNIAPTYDRLNHWLSMNIDRRWRRRTLLELRDRAPRKMLDVATGTGDFAILACDLLGPEQVTATAISEGMMAIGREKVSALGLAERVTFAKEDCTALSFADESFDAVTSAFGIRNFQDLDQGLREIYRVLRPGGCMAVCELTTPQRFPMKQLFALYAKTIIPLQGWLVSRDRHAYDYLNKSIAAFPQGERMREIIARAGFREVRFVRMTGGLCTRYIATK